MPLPAITAFFFGMMLQACILVFGEFLLFFPADPLKLCQVGGGVLLHSYFQVPPEMLDRLQVRALAGPFKDIQGLVPKPLLTVCVCQNRPPPLIIVQVL